MRRPQRLIAACVLAALMGVLGGCSSSGGGFDPSDLLDFLDTKKKLPGERKPVFPEGVPGLEQGVPKDLYKEQVEQQQRQQEQAAQAPPLEAAPPPDAKSKQAKKKGKKGADSASAAPASPDGEAAPEEDTTPAAPPAPKKKIVRKRTTAPPPDSDAQPAQSAQQSQPFPAPMPSGTFTR
jgi:hypothetical protein